MRYVQVFLLLAFLGVVGLFALQNTSVITVNLLKWSVTGPLALLAIAFYGLGMLTGWTVVAFLHRSIRRVSEHRKD